MKKAVVFIFIFGFHFLFAQNVAVVDSLLLRLKKAHDTSRVNLYNQIAYEYRNSEITKTDSFANLAIELSQKNNFLKGLGHAYINKGFVYKMSGEYAKAIESYKDALVNFVKANYKPGYATVYNNTASVYYLQSNYVKAQYYYFQALNISEELKDDIGTARTLNNIGAVYMEQSQFDKAVKYFLRAFDLLEHKDPNQAADCLNNIGTVYQYLGDTAKAIRNYQKSIEINKMLGDKKDVSYILNNIGYMFFESHQYKLALDHYFQSLQIDEEIGDIRAQSTSYGVIANCYIRLNMMHAAEKYALLVLNTAKQHNIQTDMIDAYHYLDTIAEAKGNFKLALSYHKLFKAYTDSVYNEKNRSAQEQLETIYQKDRGEKDKYISAKEDELKKFKAKEKEKEISHYILLIGMVLLLFVLSIYVIFFLLRRNKFS